MTLKTTNTVYWISTIIFAALMIFSAAGGLQPTQQAIQLIHDSLGYPVYFIQFISFAKLIGAIIILIPGLKIPALLNVEMILLLLACKVIFIKTGLPANTIMICSKL